MDENQSTVATDPDPALEKLRLEISELKERQARPWTVRLTVPVLIASLAGSFSAWLFSDSLSDQTLADIRKSVLASYFTVDNNTTGKRRQILDFVDQVLVDDARLKAWVSRERAAMEKTEQHVKAEMEEIDRELGGIDTQLQQLLGSDPALQKAWDRHLECREPEQSPRDFENRAISTSPPSLRQVGSVSQGDANVQETGHQDHSSALNPPSRTPNTAQKVDQLRKLSEKKKELKKRRKRQLSTVGPFG
ncbi:MAG: hypothetical protein AAF799_18655 [Myxococcota bacterium]